MKEYGSKFLFGPVPSRRLGLSLGVDIVPFKSCTQDCIYCQLGKAPHPQTIERKSFVDIDKVVEELKTKLNEGVKADFITISGSGEPTLNTDIGSLIDKIHQLTEIPVAVITNGTLLHIPQVRSEVGKADLVVPSLDAVDRDSFEKINRPHRDITFDRLVEGLKAFKSEYSGAIWLEIFLIDGINTGDDQVGKFEELIATIKPDKVQLNTAIRPTAEAGLMPVSAERLRQIAQRLGPVAEVIVDYDKLDKLRSETQASGESVYQMLKRRPCSLEDIVSSLGINRNEALKYVTILCQEGKIDSKQVGDKVYYKAVVDF